MKTKKLLSLVLSVIMIMSVLPMYASAADPIALTADNITVYPTAEGFIYFGQKINEGVTLTGGEVQYDGTVVAGHFEFAEPEFRPTSWASAYRPIMIFVPDDTDTYTTFEVPASKNTTFAVNKAIPVFVDENDTVPVATEVEAGAKLSTSTLSGAQVMNPYYPEESKALAGVWKWASSSTIVNESGYYEARITISGYERLTAQVYVKIASDIPETTIAEYPTIPELTYNPNVTWADIELTGGKAVIKGTETEVAGTFTIKDTRLTAIPNPNRTEIEIVFTPDDPEAALPYEFTIPVTVNALPISFGEDLKGTTVDDAFEYEVAPGTMMRDVLSYIKGGLLNYPTPSVVGIEDANSRAENGKVYKVTVLNYTNTNYTGSEAYIKAIFKAANVPMEIRSSGEGNYYIGTTDSNSPKPQGTYDIYVDGELYLENSPANFVFAPEKSGEYTVKAVYNPTENDYCIVEDIEKVIKVTHKRTLNRINTISAGYLSVSFGDTVEVTENLGENFDRWVITDSNGNEVDLGVDLTQTKISFAMPDYDITVEAKAKAGSGSTDGGIFGGIWSFFQKLINWFMNIIKQMMSLFGLGA